MCTSVVMRSFFLIGVGGQAGVAVTLQTYTEEVFISNLGRVTVCYDWDLHTLPQLQGKFGDNTLI
jgi:hypothetical protein